MLPMLRRRSFCLLGTSFHFDSYPGVVYLMHRSLTRALKSPQILELSGIGRPDVLNSVGIPVKVALDGVGENVQEHNFIGTSYSAEDQISIVKQTLTYSCRTQT